MKKQSLKLWCVCIVLVLCTQSAKAQKTYQSILKQLRNPSPHYVLTAAHRGDWRNAPENSIDAIERCIRMGIDIVEIDIRKTKDGQLVLIHDLTVDRTTSGHGRVDTWTLDSLKTLRIRQGHGGTTPGQLPTLEQAMRFVKDKPVLVNLDKGWDYLPEAYAILRKTGTVQQAIFKGKETLADMRKKYGSLMDSIIYMPMVWPMDYNIYGETAAHPAIYVEGFLDRYNPVAFEVIFNKEDSPVLLEAIPAIQKANASIWVNSLWEELCAGRTDEKAMANPDENWGWLIQKGANVIQTDRPKELLDYLRTKKLHD